MLFQISTTFCFPLFCSQLQWMETGVFTLQKAHPVNAQTYTQFFKASEAIWYICVMNRWLGLSSSYTDNQCVQWVLWIGKMRFEKELQVSVVWVGSIVSNILFMIQTFPTPSVKICSEQQLKCLFGIQYYYMESFGLLIYDIFNSQKIIFITLKRIFTIIRNIIS